MACLGPLDTIRDVAATFFLLCTQTYMSTPSFGRDLNPKSNRRFKIPAGLPPLRVRANGLGWWYWPPRAVALRGRVVASHVGTVSLGYLR